MSLARRSTLVVGCLAGFLGPVGQASAADEKNAYFQQPPPVPLGLRPMRDDTRHPAVLAAGAALRKRLGRPAPESAEARRLAGLPPPARLVSEDRGNITIIRGDQGELDVNWDDETQLQDALFTVIQHYYDTHRGRNPHFVTVLTTFAVESLAAFYMPLANDVRGIGYRHVTGEETFNSVPGLALDGILFMNNFRNYGGQYAPIGRLTFNQELGHRWGSHVYFEDRNGPSTEMLGRDCSHWSFLMDSGNSAMEGNVWIDNGNRTFTTDTSFYDFGYSGLDRYLMGFAPAEAIAPWFFITDAGAWDCDQQYQGRELNPSYYPPIYGGVQDQVSVRGTRVDVSIDDVIAAEGERRPNYDQSRKEWSMVFILAAKRNDVISDRNLGVVDQLRREWEAQWEADATQPGYDPPNLITTADGAGDPGPEPGPGPGPRPGEVGARCESFADCDPAVAERCVALEVGTSVCTILCEVDRDCPNNFCCVPSMPGAQQDRFNWFCVAQQGEVCYDYTLPEPEPEPEPEPDPAGGNGGGGGEPTPAPGGDTPVPDDDTPEPVGGVDPGTLDAGLSGDPVATRVDNEGSSGSVTGCNSRPGLPVSPWALLPLAAVFLRRRRRA